ncbi:unnamed protein product [Rotaria sp. Silwood1]|nr:unnamed protein product [Rotaria sp. Silwood1]CAF3633880.1 unnamed protein product [Rotaria sp. Silwood1]CAF5135388.1 unnamed protein product [Rotaria sp. Silwood1]
MSNSLMMNKQNQDTVLNMIPTRNSSVESQKIFSITNEQLETILERLIKLQSPPVNVSNAIGNPGPLGLAAFSLPTFMLSVFNAGSNLIDPRLELVVLPVAFFYGGLTQFVAGMWEFRVNNTFGATTFTSYGAFWMSFAAYIYFIVPKIESINKTKKATGLFLLSWFIFTIYMNIAAWRISKLLFSLITILNFVFLFLIIGLLADVPVLVNIGGWLGIILAALAWYSSAAAIINTTYKKVLLPTGAYIEKEKSSKTLTTRL